MERIHNFIPTLCKSIVIWPRIDQNLSICGSKDDVVFCCDLKHLNAHLDWVDISAEQPKLFLKDVLFEFQVIKHAYHPLKSANVPRNTDPSGFIFIWSRSSYRQARSLWVHFADEFCGQISVCNATTLKSRPPTQATVEACWVFLWRSVKLISLYLVEISQDCNKPPN